MVQILRTGGGNPLASMLGRRKTKCALRARGGHHPVCAKQTGVITPEGVSWWQDWMDHAEPGDPWWDAIDYGAAAQSYRPP